MIGRAVLWMTCWWIPLPAWGQGTVSVGPNVWLSRANPAVVQAEPVIAVDPRHPSRLVAAAIGLRRPHAHDWQDHQTILVYRSEDGGASWLPVPLAALPDSWTAGDPWLAWLPDGQVILSAIAGGAITRRGDPPARARLFLSTDGGRQWDRGGHAPFPSGSAEDHPVLAVGRRGAELAVYVLATHAGSTAAGIDVVAVGTSGADVESIPPIRLSRAQINLGGAVVGRDGELIVSYYSMRPPRSLWAARYDRARASWTEAVLRDTILPAGFPALAVDSSEGPFAGRVYGAWVEGDDQAGMRVFVSWSDDSGGTWSAPTRVHADTSRVARTLPVVAVAPDGAVGVVWQDARNAGGRDCFDLYGAISTSGGASFLPEARVSSETACAGSFEQNGAAAARFRIGGGDYLGLVGVGPQAFQAVWADTRMGRYQIWTARLSGR